MEREVVTRVAEKFQLTIPPEIRDIYDLRVGDLFQWNFDEAAGTLTLVPKRAQLITPQLRERVRAVREERRRLQDGVISDEQQANAR